MRIGIDATHISRQGKGLFRFQHCFLQALATSQTRYQFVIFLNSRADLPPLPQANHFIYVLVRPPNLFTWEQVQLPALARQWNVQLVQSMSDRLPIVGRTRYLLYLSEVPDHRIRAMWPQAGVYQRTSDILTRLIFPYSVRRAVRIVVPSRATRTDLLSLYRASVAKVRVVYEAAGEQFVPEPDSCRLQGIRARYGASDGYILHFSSANDPRDNTAMVLRAFGRCLKQLGPVRKLIVAGKPHFRQRGLDNLVWELGLADHLVLTGFVSDEELVELYQAADVYFDPSLYEGFGLQVLEAMACGAPVVCSNVSSLPEVAGDAAIMLSPMDEQGFADALVWVLTDADKAKEMRRRGRERAGHFSWHATAQELMQVYAEVLS